MTPRPGPTESRVPSSGPSSVRFHDAAADPTRTLPALSESRAPVPSDAPRLGRYAVVGRLGRGGMGEVLRVRDLELDREMAAKVMLELSDARQLEKFLLEARITGQLEHPAIVPVHELGRTTDGRAYFTMKRVQGEDLARVLDRLAEDPEARPTLAERLGIFTKVCDAMAFAHARGVIHRDLKPANVMVGEFGEVQVMDWGLAKVLGQQDAARVDATHAPGADAGGDPLATRDGTILGTPAYMPPEQAEGRIADLDQRSDVYALGAILYHLLVLVPPYVGESVWDVLDQVTRGELVSPLDRVPERRVPWELSAAVMKAMAADPDARYPSVAALAGDVQAWLRGGTLGAARYTSAQRVAKWVRRHRSIALATLALVVASVGWSGHAAWQRRLERRAEVAAAVASARGLLERHPCVAASPRVEVAVDDATTSDVPESLDERAQRERAIAARFQAASALDRALVRSGDDDVVRALRARVGLELGHLALVGRDYGLAVQAYRDLARFGASDAEVAHLLDTVETARAARHSAIERRVRSIVEDVGAGLARPGRPPRAPDLDDYVFEAASYRELVTVRVLGAALEPLIERGRVGGRSVAWSDGETDLARFACRVLGRLRLAEPGPVLARWMEVVWDPDLALDAGRALVRLPGAIGHRAARAACERLGPVSAFAQEILPRLAQVEPVAADDPADLATPLAVAQAVGELLVARQPDRAMRLIQQAIARHPDWESALLVMRAATSTDLRDWDGARRDLDQHLAREPSSAPALRARGHLRKLQNDIAGAEADLRRSLEREPRAIAHRDLADIAYYVRRDLEAAGRELDLAVGLAPNDAEILAFRGIVLAARGREREAMADLDRAVALDSQSANSLASRGTARLMLRQTSLAIADLNRALELDPDNVHARTSRAVAQIAAGALDGALADARRAVELAPNAPETHRTLCEAHAHRDELEAALAAAERTLALRAEDLVARKLRAQLRECLRDVTGALADWDQVAAHAPLDPEIYPARARLHRARGDYERALVDHARALELAQGAARLEAQLARCLTYVERGAFAEAEADAAAILAAAPDHALAAAARALNCAAQGRTDEARGAFEAVRLRDPGGAYWPLWVVALGGPPSVVDAASVGEAWPAPVARVLGGHLALAAASHALEPLGPRVRGRRRCELFAFAGAAHERAGRVAEARAAYETAVAQGMPDSWQYTWAVVRLRALGR